MYHIFGITSALCVCCVAISFILDVRFVDVPGRCIYVCMYGHTSSKSIDRPGKVANPARSQLNREKGIFPCPRSRLRIWSRETVSAVPSRVA